MSYSMRDSPKRAGHKAIIHITHAISAKTPFAKSSKHTSVRLAVNGFGNALREHFEALALIIVILPEPRRNQELAEQTSGVHFLGRLGTYKYYNMDQVVAQALTLYSKLTGVSRREMIVSAA